MDIHNEEIVSFLSIREERNKSLIEIKLLKDKNLCLNDELVTLRLKVKNLEKELEVKKNVEPLGPVEKEIEKPKKGKFQI